MPQGRTRRHARTPQQQSVVTAPFEVTITDIGHSGEGVGKHAGLTVFVPGALPGDTVLVQPLEIHQRYAHARILDLVEPSSHRIKPACPVFNECGGCQLQHLSYEAQLTWKQDRVGQVLARLGKIDKPFIKPIIAAENPWDYRNKAQFPVGLVDDQVTLGFYRKGSHDLVPVEECLVQHVRLRQAAQCITWNLRRLQVAPYNEATHIGLLRHVLCRISFATGELLITFVAVRNDPVLHELAAAVASDLSSNNLAGVTLNINQHSGNRILGTANHVLLGNGYISETLCVGGQPLQFHISAPAFFQVNPVQAQELFTTAVRYAAVDASTRVLDAFCGTGSIALFIAKAGAGSVWGIEESPEAIADARSNTDLNGIRNASFVVGRVEEVAEELAAQEGRPDVLVVDPPRAGLHPDFIKAALGWRPIRWVYVSCNPATLARDVALICSGGYTLQEVQPVDMFPHTSHIECVALMSRAEG